MDHYSIDIHYNEEQGSYSLHETPLSPIPDDKKIEKKEDPFIIDNYPELAWLNQFRIEGYPDVIRVPFRMPPFQKEYVPCRIESYEKRYFKCRVLCQPRMDCKINEGDIVDVEHFMFEHMHHLDCKTIEERKGFEL
jgi:hypothetical protein